MEAGSSLYEGGCVINAAGIYSGKIVDMVGDDSFSIFPARGEYYLLNSEIEEYVRRINFPLPTEESKGIFVTPVAEGSIIFGLNHQPRTYSRSGNIETCSRDSGGVTI